VSYVYYNLNTLKVERECLFPAETQALLGRSDYRVTLHSCGEVIHLHIMSTFCLNSFSHVFVITLMSSFTVIW